MTIKERVQGRLKPKVKQFGFNKKVLKSVAAKIADKLEDIDEDASEDDINAKIDSAIEDSLPFLALAQSSANEQFEEWKRNYKPNDDDDDDDDDSSNRNRQSRSNKSQKTKENDEEPAWFKKFREEQEAKFAKLAGEKIAETRNSKLEKLLKDTGTFGTRIIKNFSKMNFKDDDEFDEFFSEVEADLKAYNQERADSGLSSMGNPPGGKGGKQNSTVEEITDADIDAIVANLGY